MSLSSVPMKQEPYGSEPNLLSKVVRPALTPEIDLFLSQPTKTGLNVNLIGTGRGGPLLSSDLKGY